MQLIWLIDAVEIIIIRRFFHVVFSLILAFSATSIILIFWIFLIVFWLTTCAHDFEFVIACLIVIMKTIKIINDLINLKFEKILDLNVLWFDDFIWNDLIELIVCDFLKFCAVFVVLKDCLIRNLHAVQPGQCFLMRVANIWSRLLKHNWWNFLYERIRIHSNVFFDFTFNENSPLYGYINRASFEFQSMHVYDQQLWSLFFRCESFFLFLNSWR